VTAKVVLLPAQILNSNTTPITLFPKQGIGTSLQVISASGFCNFNTTPYATHKEIRIGDKAASHEQFGATLWGMTVVGQHNIPLQITGAINHTQITENTDLQIWTDNGNPTAGDSSFTIFATIKINIL
jgi:hypothetical protein